MTRVAVLLLALGCDAPEPSAPTTPSPIAPTTPSPIAAPVAPPVHPPVVHPPVSAPALREAPPGFTDLRRALPQLHFRIGYASDDNFTGAPLPGYGAPGAWLRDAAATALAEAARTLAEQRLQLVVFDAYRPRRASEAMVAWTRTNDRGDLLRDGYVASRSQHNRGIAIDIGLCDQAGTPLDMGSAWDHFGPESALGAAAGVPAQRRASLQKAMRAAGFRPYTAEWWHFTFPAEDAAELDVPYGRDEAAP